ncbi:hypothetical protein HS7_11010 [Sulfolobales archaeon HS-7]|nr:hypothetical protein HS7_11010 [Sulfolobales archaeon HS-7]
MMENYIPSFTNWSLGRGGKNADSVGKYNFLGQVSDRSWTFSANKEKEGKDCCNRTVISSYNNGVLTSKDVILLEQGVSNG